MKFDMDTLRAIRNLAERGATEGERDAARRTLERVLAKTGIDAAELDKQERKVFSFSYKDAFEKKILVQIHYKVTNDKTLRVTRYRGNSKSLNMPVTAAEYDEIITLFAIYRKALKAELERCLDAFIQVNRLFGELKEDEEAGQISEEEYNELMRMMRVMKRVTVPIPKERQIEEHNGD